MPPSISSERIEYFSIGQQAHEETSMKLQLRTHWNFNEHKERETIQRAQKTCKIFIFQLKNLRGGFFRKKYEIT